MKLAKKSNQKTTLSGRWLSTREACQLLGISRTTFDRLRKVGPSRSWQGVDLRRLTIRRVGWQIRINEDELRALMLESV